MIYSCSTKIKCTLSLIYLFCNNVCNVCLGCTESQLGISLWAVFLSVCISDCGCELRQWLVLFLSLESELILGNQCHHLKQILQCHWELLPASSAWVPVFLIHLPFLYLNMREASPKDDERIQSGQAEVILLHVLGSWSNPWQLLLCYRKEGSCRSYSVFW